MKLYIDVDKNIVLQGEKGASGAYASVKRGYITAKRGSRMSFEVYPVHTDMVPMAVNSKLVFGIKEAGVFDGVYLAGGTANKAVDADGVMYWRVEVVFQSEGIDAVLHVDGVGTNDKASVDCGGEFSWMMDGKVSSFSVTFPVVVQNNINRDLDPPPALLPMYPQATDVATQKDVERLVKASLPIGGKSGQMLAKAGAENYNVGWVDPAPVDGMMSPSGEKVQVYDVVGHHPTHVGLDFGGMFKLIGMGDYTELLPGSRGYYGGRLKVDGLLVGEGLASGMQYGEITYRSNKLYVMDASGGEANEIALVKDMKGGQKVIYPTSAIYTLLDSDIPDGYNKLVVNYCMVSGDDIGINYDWSKLVSGTKHVEIEILPHAYGLMRKNFSAGGSKMKIGEYDRKLLLSYTRGASPALRVKSVDVWVIDHCGSDDGRMALSANMGLRLTQRIEELRLSCMNKIYREAYVGDGGNGGGSVGVMEVGRFHSGIRQVDIHVNGIWFKDFNIWWCGQDADLVELNIYMCQTRAEKEGGGVLHTVGVCDIDGVLKRSVQARGTSKLSMLIARDSEDNGNLLYGKLHKVYDCDSV